MEEAAQKGKPPPLSQALKSSSGKACKWSVFQDNIFLLVKPLKARAARLVRVEPDEDKPMGLQGSLLKFLLLKGLLFSWALSEVTLFKGPG